MTIREFAEKYRVKMTAGKQGTEDLVLGKYGEIAGTYRNGQMRLRLLAVPRDRVMNGALNNRKAEAAAGGMIPLHVTPNVYESIWGFDPTDTRLAELAINLVQPRRKRVRILTDEQKTLLTDRLRRLRSSLNPDSVSGKPHQGSNPAEEKVFGRGNLWLRQSCCCSGTRSHTGATMFAGIGDAVGRADF